ncbi:hypothetical protein TWF225_009047 [Orbilia oligospora]|uniref:Uncharacterized protein n=1 Tax=Orbilia oligospora TaxID=2813651 RepID=A0A7C8PLD8_ORBOL|nr:hypothetical protein TWF751_006197 [Orbilia oligospora]KAF3175153.1 hypothetical protein TWF225_009047 [Orbilia oligospora]KAF3241729.1 hypothetical protein TWF128_010722 [Orbilia oligospora]KAF3248712.1 hypothetical protein TWF217_009068 [Orbilia oligospora]KAF3292579.1 hypothetical protein TWF132_005625 [Orbilia oligospora]
MRLSVDGARQWELLRAIKELFCSRLACYNHPADQADSLQQSRSRTFFQSDMRTILQHIQADSEIPSQLFERCIRSLDELLQAFDDIIDDGILTGNSQEAKVSKTVSPQYAKLEVVKNELFGIKGQKGAIEYLDPYIRFNGSQDYKSMIGAIKIFENDMKEVYKYSSSSENESPHTDFKKASTTKPSFQCPKADTRGEPTYLVRDMVQKLHSSLIRLLGCYSSAHKARLHIPARDEVNPATPGASINVDIYLSTCANPSGWQGAKCTIQSCYSSSCSQSQPEARDLCRAINRSQMRKRQLHLLSIGERLHDLPSRRERLDTSQYPSKSLRELLNEGHFSHFGKHKVSLKERRILAVILGHLMLELCDGPWIRETWDAGNIYFLCHPSNPNVINLRQPYVDSCLSSKQRPPTPDGLESSDINQFHKYPLILDFARLLVEIQLGETIQPTEEDCPSGTETPDTAFFMIDRIFHDISDDIYEDYRSAIDACLECDQFLPEAASFDHPQFRDLVYQNIVAPLEQELLKGFNITVAELSTLQFEDGRSSQKPTSNSSHTTNSKSRRNGSPRSTTPPLVMSENEAIFTSKPASFEYAKINSSRKDYPVVNGRNGISHVRVDTMSSCVSSSVEIYPPESFKIAIICPMAVELAPILAIMDTEYPNCIGTQRNNYTLGRIGNHNVVVTVMPGIGNNRAAAVVTQLTNDFKSLKFGLLVGIGGGIPDVPQYDIRLGDVVVSKPTANFGGAVQFDRGKTHPNNHFERTGHLNKPSWFLMSNLHTLIARHSIGPNKISDYLSEMTRNRPHMVQRGYVHPGEEHDVLYEHDYRHKSHTSDCRDCDQSKKVERPSRASSDPMVHYGTIGSANTVLKDGDTREQLKKDLGIICVDMEAAGIIDDLPCLIIRGICDYADSHKAKKWQPYAAATAAAFAKEFLSVVPPDFSINV